MAGIEWIVSLKWTSLKWTGLIGWAVMWCCLGSDNYGFICGVCFML